MKTAFLSALLFLSVSLCSSCYSIRLSNKDGIPEPDPLQTEAGYYRGKKVTVIDTTINLKLLENGTMFLETCAEGSFHTVEYRVTLGHVLLSGITLGKKRKVQVKYVCVKEAN